MTKIHIETLFGMFQEYQANTLRIVQREPMGAWGRSFAEARDAFRDKLDEVAPGLSEEIEWRAPEEIDYLEASGKGS